MQSSGENTEIYSVEEPVRDTLNLQIARNGMKLVVSRREDGVYEIISLNKKTPNSGNATLSDLSDLFVMGCSSYVRDKEGNENKVKSENLLPKGKKHEILNNATRKTEWGENGQIIQKYDVNRIITTQPSNHNNITTQPSNRKSWKYIIDAVTGKTKNCASATSLVLEIGSTGTLTYCAIGNFSSSLVGMLWYAGSTITGGLLAVPALLCGVCAMANIKNQFDVHLPCLKLCGIGVDKVNNTTRQQGRV